MNTLGRKKIAVYGLMLAGAIVGLVIDRWRGPAAAQAAPPMPAARITQADPAALADIKGPSIARVFDSDPHNARPTSANEPIRDAFALTPEMQKLYLEESPEKKAETARAAESQEELRRRLVEEFQTAHKLKGTTIRDNVAWAIINDQVVQVGGQVDGFELQRVEHYRVYLKKDGVEAALTLPIPH